MPIPLELLPAQIRPRVGKDAPTPMRMMVARALLPMGPDDLFATLAYLVSNETGEIQSTALQSLKDMPQKVVTGLLKASRNGDLLDFSLRTFIEDAAVVEEVLLNPAVPDVAVEWAARRVHGRQIDLISQNQERLIRHGPIVEALYYNPEASMAVVNAAFETAVRHGLDLSHIPGFREIYESIFGKKPAAQPVVPVAQAPKEAPKAPPPTEDLDELDDLQVSDAEPDDVAAPVEEFLAAELQGGLQDDDYVKVLMEAAKEEDSDVSAADEKEEKQSLHALIAAMSIPQKIRLALVGSASARNILIRDSKITVALSVLKNAKITEKEVALFAKNKSLNELIIQTIARNREWTRSRTVQSSLIHHPKTPPVYANRWIRTLSPKELKDLSRSREVPGYIQRLARNILQQRDAPKGKK